MTYQQPPAQPPWGPPPARQAWGPPPQPGRYPRPWSPQPAWQQWPPQAWQAPQPVRRSGGAIKAVIIGMVVVLGLGFLAFVAATFLFLSLAAREPIPTVGPVPAPTSMSPTPSPDPTPPGPTPQPTPTDPADYDPPPLPRPKSLEEAERWLRANALYAERTQQIDCAIKRLKSDRAPKDLAALDTHLNRTIGCLMKVWNQPMSEAGFVLLQPPVRSYDKPITTACGTSPAMDQAAAFYCSGDQRIYYAVNRKRPLYYRTPLAVDSTLAHEFGHALQGRTGILPARRVILQTVEDEDEALEYSRRTELQADCLAGIAMNSLAKATGLTKKERQLLREDNYSRGDREGYPRTHGAPESGLHWIGVGLDTREIGRCNTFTATSKQVE